MRALLAFINKCSIDEEIPMKLFEIAEKPAVEHGFFQPMSGPNKTPGVSLHYVQNAEHHHDHLRGQAAEKGDERWTRNIEQMAGRTTQKFYTPQLGWYMSKESFRNGESHGFGKAKDDLMKEHPNLIIHPSKEDAIEAAGY